MFTLEGIRLVVEKLSDGIPECDVRQVEGKKHPRFEIAIGGVPISTIGWSRSPKKRKSGSFRGAASQLYVNNSEYRALWDCTMKGVDWLSLIRDRGKL